MVAASAHNSRLSNDDDIRFSTTESYQLFRRLFMHSPEPVVILRDVYTIIDCNHAALALWGYPRDEFLDLDPLQLTTEETRHHLPAFLREENLRKGHAATGSLLCSSGSVFRAEINSRPLVVGDDTYRWVTIRKLPDTEPYNSIKFEPQFSVGKLHEQLVEHIREPEMVVEFSCCGEVISANALCLERTGYMPGHIEHGINIIQLIVPEEHERALHDLARLVTGEKIGIAEYGIICENGTILPAICSMSPTITNGVVTGFRAIALDMSDHKRVEQNLLVMEKLRVLGELSGGVVHDFNNILSIILGYIEMLQQTIIDPHQRNIATKIERAARDGAEIVKRIRAFSQMNESQEFSPVDPNVIVREVVEQLNPRVHDKSSRLGSVITLTHKLSPVPPVMVIASEMREVLVNLVINAIDAIERNGAVTVSTATNESSALIIVTDNGCGMSPEIADRIFEPFFTTKTERGTGFGMSVSYGIIKKFGGEIAVKSEEGTGTTMTVSVPIKEVGSYPIMPQETCEQDDPVANVLVIDDDENIRDILREFLANEGHDVTLAASGEDGLISYRRGDFDVVLTDYSMETVSGWDLARAIKEHDPSVGVILLSGWGEDINSSSDPVIIDACLPKPISFAELLSVIRRIMYRRLS